MTGTPQSSPHLEFKGEPEHHDALQKRYSFVHICKSRNDSRVKIWLFEPVNYSRQFRVVFLFLPSLWLFLVAVSFFKVFGD
jgi:hypothetical protein